MNDDTVIQEFMFNRLAFILEMEKAGLVTRTFRRLDPDRQATVISAILGEAGETGPLDINVKRIARRAGVSTGSLYQYFQNRENLVSFTIQLSVRQTVGLFESYRPMLTGVPLAEILPAYITEGIKWTEDRAGMTRFFGTAAYRGDDLSAKQVVRPIASVLLDLMRDMVTGAAAAGELRSGLDVEAVTRLLHTFTLATGDYFIYPGLTDYYQLVDEKITPERILSVFVDLVMNGIAKEKGK